MEVLHGMLEQIEHQRLNKMMDEMPDNGTIQQRFACRRKALNSLFVFAVCVCIKKKEMSSHS